MYTFPLHKTNFFSWQSSSSNLVNRPVLLKKILEVDNPADTYLNMKKYTKGYIWVNGNNLGRFWNVGPQFKLFCPGVWLKKGSN
jgi:beta-galactosidase